VIDGKGRSACSEKALHCTRELLQRREPTDSVDLERGQKTPWQAWKFLHLVQYFARSLSTTPA
jgi:hypothetical protein